MRQLNKSRYNHWMLPGIKAIPRALLSSISFERFAEPAPEFVKLFFGLEKRVVIYGEDNIPEDGPVYFIAEHRRLLDPVYMVDSVVDITSGKRWPRYIMRDNFLAFDVHISEWFNNIAEKYFRTINFARDSQKNILGSLNRVFSAVAEELSHDGSVAICPGATRSRDGSPYSIRLSSKNIDKMKTLDPGSHPEYIKREMASRAAMFLTRFRGSVSIVPVGVTLNDFAQRIYLNFGEPIPYSKGKSGIEDIVESIRQFAGLKVVGMNNLLPYLLCEYEALDRKERDQEHAVWRHHCGDFWIKENILFKNMLSRAFDELRKTHSFFDVDLYDPYTGEFGLQQPVFREYMRYFAQKKIVLEDGSKDGPTYLLNPDKADDLEGKLRKSSPARYHFNELDCIDGIRKVCDAVLYNKE